MVNPATAIVPLVVITAAAIVPLVVLTAAAIVPLVVPPLPQASRLWFTHTKASVPLVVLTSHFCPWLASPPTTPAAASVPLVVLASHFCPWLASPPTTPLPQASRLWFSPLISVHGWCSRQLLYYKIPTAASVPLVVFVSHCYL